LGLLHFARNEARVFTILLIPSIRDNFSYFDRLTIIFLLLYKLLFIIIRYIIYLKKFDSFATNISSFNQANYLELKENPLAPRGTLGQSKEVYLPQSTQRPQR
jgi:hypothetical protein